MNFANFGSYPNDIEAFKVKTINVVKYFTIEWESKDLYINDEIEF